MAHLCAIPNREALWTLCGALPCTHPPTLPHPHVPPSLPPSLPRDYVKKIAVYKDKLAVQLQNKVVIYELANADDFDMHYQVGLVCVCVWGCLGMCLLRVLLRRVLVTRCSAAAGQPCPL